ncbi:MAG: cob(I)yrinic acid a,c-diamide adenosyltransferase [Patescibacteria group bacterium]|nr:cob(I)yrinic acid a,c-diamide adenosyltransferase [Patescibacteria group bacterium]
MIFVLTGNGKGKTTCAVGMGVRAAGAGRKVLMVQFLKAGGSGEEAVLSGLKNFKIKSFGAKHFILPPYKSEKDKQLAMAGWDLVKQSVDKKRADFFILDEIILALNYGLLNKKQVLGFLRKYKKNIDFVLTGRGAASDIVEIADLASEVKNIKHYFDGQGVLARKGIEF